MSVLTSITIMSLQWVSTLLNLVPYIPGFTVILYPVVLVTVMGLLRTLWLMVAVQV